jgi:hypothetical protein
MLHKLLNPATSLSWPFCFHHRLQRIPDFLVRPLGGDGDSAADAIIHFVFVPGGSAPAVIYDHSHLNPFFLFGSAAAIAKAFFICLFSLLVGTAPDGLIAGMSGPNVRLAERAPDQAFFLRGRTPALAPTE